MEHEQLKYRALKKVWCIEKVRMREKTVSFNAALVSQ